MRVPHRTILLTIGLAALCVPLSGCFVAADLLNESALSSLGIDSSAVSASEGRVLIAFDNNTSGEITSFTAQVSGQILGVGETTAADLQTLYATNIPAGETRTLVVDCPTGTIIPGTATLVRSDESLATTVYGGSMLTSGSEFVCGDVIEFSLLETTTSETDAQGNTTTTSALTISVRILPGI